MAQSSGSRRRGETGGVTDEAIADALRKARNNGILAVAAAGNDHRQDVSFPGSNDNCVAVSAAGRQGLFPKTATESDDVAAPFGTDPDDFVAAFSNTGTDLDLTGSGVGVVSTFPGGYGSMSGTSMASPAVAGMAARPLAQDAAILAMPRKAERADAIRRLLLKSARSMGFGILFEGAGLPHLDLAMPRFTLYRTESSPVTDATEQVRSVGARVITARPGLALIEATEQAAQTLRANLPDWRVSAEVAATIPRPRPNLSGNRNP